MPFWISWSRYLSIVWYLYNLSVFSELAFSTNIPCDGGTRVLKCLYETELNKEFVAHFLLGSGASFGAALSALLLIVYVIILRIGAYLLIRFLVLSDGRD